MIEDPIERLRVALGEVYAYDRATERMRANLLRDIDALPAAIADAIATFPLVMREVLAVGWPSDGLALHRAALGHALAFETWQSLAREGLDDVDAARLMVRFVTHATG